ncbi:hypothetical protein LIER_37352 [Lithospermum erythrorhizon]|uniref:Uncharacterized protein n=1 Tax=Lithospermum erythrorhizon TaxID=34254 RepID=A0AAV3PLH8_LITER
MDYTRVAYIWSHVQTFSSSIHNNGENERQNGSVIWLRIGLINTMVVLTANTAAEVYQKHDLSFSDRCVFVTATSYDYHKGSIFFSPYGPY